MDLSYREFMNHLIDDWPQSGDYREYLNSMNRLWEAKLEEDVQQFHYGNYDFAMIESCYNDLVVYIKLLMGRVKLTDQLFHAVVVRNFYGSVKAIVESGLFVVQPESFSSLLRGSDDRIVELLVKNVTPPKNEELDSEIIDCYNPWAIIGYIERFSITQLTIPQVTRLLSEHSYIVVKYAISRGMVNTNLNDYNMRLLSPFSRNMFSFLLTGQGNSKELLSEAVSEGLDQAVYVLIESGKVQLNTEQLRRIKERVGKFASTNRLLTVKRF